MSEIRQYRSSGRIDRPAGAAAAALKARAAAWEVPLVEADERLSLFVWGCELRLSRDGSGLAVDLSAPEDRLIGTLRDSATELFAEVGLEVVWDRVDVGALAPGLSLLRVVAVTRPVPGYLRVRLAGPEAARFATGGLHVRLLLPSVPGRAPVWPRVAASGRTVWPAGPDALHRPVYTVAVQGADWLDIDIYRHDDSPTCRWAETVAPGTEVGLMGPGGGGCPEGARLWLFGDGTALPAIGRMLAVAPVPVRAWVSCAAEDMGALALDPRVTRCDDLLAALDGAGALAPEDHVWFAASGTEARAARKALTARGHARAHFTAAAYWDRG
ncbi:siderophore-interacting protein [Frigidibacter sp. MR17.14]|uniref:siderophore-interacting protein n=1 Tax=Frigidibacter sp. MR17.14 TaxID=3126509 RepID=UPI003012D115